jgi:predicted nucleic acid-binding protein
MWRAGLNQAIELSRTHSPKLGTRAFDVLHVACALELKLKHFPTFDERQKKLAAACGLKLVKL